MGNSCFMQVGPALLVLGDEARENGLKYSLLDRLWKTYQRCDSVAKPYTATLIKNYRCHESILAIPNQLFYCSELTSNVPNNPNGSYSLFFVCSSLSHTQPSPELEARVLLNEVAHRCSYTCKERKMELNEISVVTTTQTQVINCL